MTRGTTACTALVVVGALLAGCSNEPELPGVDVFTVESVALERTISPSGFVEAAISLDSCVLSDNGVLDVSGDIDLRATGVTSDGPVTGELIVDIMLGGTRIAGVLTGEVERTGSFAVTYPFEELHGEEAAVVAETYVGEVGDFLAMCQATLVTRRVEFLPAEPIELVPADGVIPRR